MNVRLQIVPNMDPNADAEPLDLIMVGMPTSFREMQYHVADLLPIGHHMVGYEVLQ